MPFEIPVENIRIGDRLELADGGVREVHAVHTPTSSPSLRQVHFVGTALTLTLQVGDLVDAVSVSAATDSDFKGL